LLLFISPLMSLPSMSQNESRVHKFIVRGRSSASELDVAAMERLGVKVKQAEYVATPDGQGISMLAHLAEKMRRSDIFMKLFGEGAPYNAECEPSQQVQGRVEVLVESGETKAEYQRVLAAHFVASGAKKGMENAEELSPMCKYLDKRFSDLAVQILGSKDQSELFALRQENEALRKGIAPDPQIQPLQSRIKELEDANAAWLQKKDSFDRLTLDYAAWRFDLRGKDVEIASLQARTAELEHALAQMTDRRNVLAARCEAQEKELVGLRPLRFGAFP
jgi:hypothetical protein